MTTIFIIIAAALGGVVVFYWCRWRNRLDAQMVADAGHILSEEARPEVELHQVGMMPVWNAVPKAPNEEAPDQQYFTPPLKPDWRMAAAGVQDWEQSQAEKQLVIDPGAIIALGEEVDKAEKFDADMLAHLIEHKVA